MPLCQICQQINFDTLRTLTPEDLEHVKAGSGGDGIRFARSDTPFDRVLLGPLERIRKDAATCALCKLFLDIISTQGAVLRNTDGDISLDTDSVIWKIDSDTSYYGEVRSLGSRQQVTYLQRRFSLTAHPHDDMGKTIAYLDHALQPCDVGELQRDLWAEGDSRMAFGGRRRPRNLDMRLIRQWMQTCSNEHGSACESGDGSHMSLFRLIDLHQMCIVQLHDCHIRSLEFAVLSYVWGTVKVVKLIKHNLDAFQQPGSFENNSLPRTISDSIYFARNLGLQYLWVDALCILQDSDEDKAYQISNMGNVYSSAFVTVVAASGLDANAGLPGVSIDREGEQQEVVVIPPSNEDPGLSVLNTLKSYPPYFDEYYLRGKESVDLSKWSQRAWTLQESALSRRKITFTAQQVFWTCHQGYYCEESRFEIPGFYVKHWLPSIHKVTFQELATKSREPWDWYGHLVSEDYSRRDLSYDGDFGSAFDAIIKNMERYTGTKFHWGMPRSHFELAVMWNGFHAVDRRTALTTLPMTNLRQRVAFPSWSWMGWRGESSCRVVRDRQESEHSTIACYVHHSEPLRFQHISQLDDGQYQSELLTQQYIDARKIAVADLQTHLPLLTPKQLSLIPDEHVLFFWTTTATFTVDYNQTKEGVTFQDYADWAWPAIQNESRQTVGKMNRLASNTSQNKRRVELIELGRRGDPDVPPEIMPQMVLVLEISRDELGVASRVNYGEIEVEAWEAAEPMACLVALA